MPHRLLLGNKPLFEYYYDYGPKPHDVLWSPADWAWIAGTHQHPLDRVVLGVSCRLGRDARVRCKKLPTGPSGAAQRDSVFAYSDRA